MIKTYVLMTAILWGSAAATAGTFTDTFFYGPTTLGGGTQHVSPTLAKFDDNLLGPGEVLLSVTFYLTANNLTDASATNAELTCGTGGCTAGGPLNLTSLGTSVGLTLSGPSALNLPATAAAVATYSPAVAVQDIFFNCVGFTCGVDNTRIFHANGILGTASTSADVLGFAPFHQAGGGSIAGLDLLIGPLQTVLTGDSGLVPSNTASLNGSVEVVYTYGTPEPMSAVLCSSALAGLAALRRRRQRQ